MPDNTTAPAAGDGVTTLPPQTRDTAPVLPDEAKQAMMVLLVQMMGNSVIAQQDFITTHKMLDLDYLENKRSVTPQEALGLKELDSTGASKP